MWSRCLSFEKHLREPEADSPTDDLTEEEQRQRTRRDTRERVRQGSTDRHRGVREAGGRFTNIDGIDGPHGRSGVSSNSILHKDFISALNAEEK